MVKEGIDIDYDKLIAHVEQCKPFIINGAALNNLDLDFKQVDIDAFLVDKHEDLDGTNWEFSLQTTMYSKTDSIRGRDVYSVRWHFKDIWGNCAHFNFANSETSGALSLEPVYYDVDDGIAARIIFSIITNHPRLYFDIENGNQIKYGEPIFVFDEPDQISILSVEMKGHQTIDKIPSKQVYDEMKTLC